MPEENNDKFVQLKGWVKDSLSKHADWYKEAKECFDFVAGRSVKGSGQWPDTSWDEMIASGRQPVEFNRVGPIVDSICGMEVNNRQEIKYLPRTQGDTEVDERLTSLADWARDETQAEDEESAMFRDSTICGRGWTETRIDFDEEPTGKIVVDHLNPLEVGVDPACLKSNFQGSRYRWRFKDIDATEAMSMFKGLAAPVIDAAWCATVDTTDGGEGNKRDYPDETRPALKGNKSRKTVRVVQIQWWEREDHMMVAGPDSAEPEMLKAEEWADDPRSQSTNEESGEPSYTASKVQTRKYYQAFLGRSQVLEETDIKCFTIQGMTGRLDRSKGYHYGVVRPMRDPQMLANKTLSQVLHILNTNAKGGLIIEKGVFANPRDAEKDWSDPSKTIVVNAGGMEKIKDRTAPSMPVALVQLQEFSISSIRDVTGVSVEMLGLADREQAASLEYQRRQSAMTILASLFDGLRRYRKTQGLVMLEQLKQLPPGVLVRVLIDPKQAMMQWQAQMQQWGMAKQAAEAQGQMFQAPPPPKPGDEFLKQPRGEMFDPAAFGLSEDARFDVIVDEAPSSPNQKEATWAALQPFMSELPPSAVQIALKYSPLPESAAKELGDAITEGAGGGVPPELQQKISEGEQQIQQLTTENAQLKQANANKTEENAVKQQEVAVKNKEADTKRIEALTPEPADDPRIDELFQHIATLAQAQKTIIDALGGNNGTATLAG